MADTCSLLKSKTDLDFAWKILRDEGVASLNKLMAECGHVAKSFNGGGCQGLAALAQRVRKSAGGKRAATVEDVIDEDDEDETPAGISPDKQAVMEAHFDAALGMDGALEKLRTQGIAAMTDKPTTRQPDAPRRLSLPANDVGKGLRAGQFDSMFPGMGVPVQKQMAPARTGQFDSLFPGMGVPVKKAAPAPIPSTVESIVFQPPVQGKKLKRVPGMDPFFPGMNVPLKK